VTGPQAINQVLRRKHARNAISSQQDCTKRRHQQAPHAKPSASVTTTELCDDKQVSALKTTKKSKALAGLEPCTRWICSLRPDR
jgi:hypothetical protein